jgi:predicted TIM-barrel fold metal-dependent hydrolase
MTANPTTGPQPVDPFGDRWMISVDDHVVEPPGVWVDRVSSKYSEQVPRIVRDEHGEAWVYEGKRMPTTGLAAAAGKDREEFSPAPVTYEEMRPGCYNPTERIKDMDADRVAASLCFPSFPRFCGQTFYEGQDKDLGLECVRAYNDWMIDEWCGTDPGRLIPLMIIPLWAPERAAEEIFRCAEKGARGIAFSENPTPLGLPSIHDSARYWDPVFAAAQETELPICTHVGSSSKITTTSPDAPLMVGLILTPFNAMMTCVDWICSGLFQRFPSLKLCLSEGGVGWVPYVLDRAQHTFNRQLWAQRGDFTFDLLETEIGQRQTDTHMETTSPIEVFQNHIYGCFIEDPLGAAAIGEHIPLDNVMVETDYPHTDSTWPKSWQTLAPAISHLDPDAVDKVTYRNAQRLFRFEPSVGMRGERR